MDSIGNRQVQLFLVAASVSVQPADPHQPALRLRAARMERLDVQHLRFALTSALEPSTNIDAWQYACQNRQTQQYEGPPDVD